MTDPYAVLGLSRAATQQQILAAYRKLSRHLHPDRNPGNPAAEARYKEVQAAYEVLRDPSRKDAYDRSGADPGPPTDPGVVDLVDTIRPALMKAAGDAVKAGAPPGAADLAAEVSRLLALRERELADQVRNLEKEAAALEAMADRFTVAAGADNIPAAALRQAAKDARAIAAAKPAEIDRVKKARAYWAGVGYRRDGVLPPKRTPSLLEILGEWTPYRRPG
jgi:curved DNA-binding protein CbpA